MVECGRFDTLEKLWISPTMYFRSNLSTFLIQWPLGANSEVLGKELICQIFQWTMSLEAGGAGLHRFMDVGRTNSFYSFYNCTEIKSGISFLPDLKSPGPETWEQIMCPIPNNPCHSPFTCKLGNHFIWNQIGFEQNLKHLWFFWIKDVEWNYYSQQGPPPTW